MDVLILAASKGETIALTVFPMIGSILLAYGVYQVVVESRQGQRKRITDRLQGRSTERESRTVESILRRQDVEAGLGALGSVVGKLKITPQIQTLLDQADIQWSASRMLINQCAIAIAMLCGMLFMQYSVLAAVSCAACVVFLPIVWLKGRRAKRLKRLTQQLPDVFEIMGQALRAGHSLASALEVVYDQLPDPVGTEFGRVFHEQNLGIKLEDALVAMADRVDSLDVKFFVTAVLIQRQTGGDLAEVLDKIGRVIRDRIELFGMVQALTAEGRLSGWVLFALPFLVFAAILTLNPTYAETLFQDPKGKILLITAGGMQLMGLAMIRYIVNIKV